jgi:hypothetical protein
MRRRMVATATASATHNASRMLRRWRGSSFKPGLS